MNWPSAKLSDIALVNPRPAAHVDRESLVSFVPMSAVDADTASIYPEERVYSEVKKAYTAFLDGDVLVAKITPCFENGKIVQASLPHKLGFGSTEFHVVRARQGTSARYLLHYLRQPRIRVQGQRRMTGSAGQRRVPVQFLSELLIPVPPLAEQRRIAEVLDRAEELRAKRRAALAQLDTLTQSIFLDLFGDPSRNPKRWPIRRIRDLLVSATYGTSKKSAATGEFVVLRMNNITRTGEMDLSDLKYMDLDATERDRYLVRTGDVLFNRTNSAELVGKTAVFRGSHPMAYAGYLVRLRVNAENDPEYLAGFLNSGYAKRVLRGMCKSIIGMANINATEIQEMKIPQPLYEFQQEFARRVDSVEKLKATHRASLAELGTLFASLQHRAFQGEL